MNFEYRRHGLKNGNNISKEGLEAAEALGIELGRSRDYDVVVGGNESRTWQTLASFLLGLANYQHGQRALPPVANFGDGTLFKSWLDRGLADAVKKTGSNIRGLAAILTPEEFMAAAQNALQGVMNVAAQVSNGSVVIGFGHSPIIELAAIGAGIKLEDVPPLAELEGLEFEVADATVTVKPLKKASHKIAASSDVKIKYAPTL